MKRTELLQRLAAVASARGYTFEFVREGGNHTIYRIGPSLFPVGRHRDVPELTARRTIAAAEKLPQAGKAEDE